MLDIYGTIGPACADPEILRRMFREGMTGLRLNLSHTSLRRAQPQIAMIHEAARAEGIRAKLLIDMQGPELRVGHLASPLNLEEGTTIKLGEGGIPIPSILQPALRAGAEVLLDDGKLLLTISDDLGNARVLRGGLLRGGKSIAIPGSWIKPPTMTAQDQENIRDAAQYGVTGVMQPFVRDAQDLQTVREAMDQAGGQDIRLFAKIENMSGVENLENFFDIADEIVIARGDLGNAMPLWELPRIQKIIEGKCRKAGVPFMVVTQMLASMEHCAVPTRAEVSDIFNAVADGAASVMVTGETAVGEYPVEVIRYLARTAWEAEKYR